MSVVHSYGSIFNIGHRAIRELCNEPVVVQEKIDGSQFSFMKDEDGKVHFRSKGSHIDLNDPPKMFSKTINAVLERSDGLIPNYTYRGEALDKPKHNVITYNRVPIGNIILFDIDKGDQNLMSPAELKTEGDALYLEVVPVFYEGMVTSFEQLQDLLKQESVLGGSLVEGIVIKNYQRFTTEKKVMMGKWVREAFKEAHKLTWKNDNPGRGDIIAALIKSLATEARWRKAIIHLQERGQLLGEPKDIALLIPEVVEDTFKEEKEHIMNVLWGWAYKDLKRGLTKGLPEWYKAELAKEQWTVDIRPPEFPAPEDYVAFLSGDSGEFTPVPETANA